MPLLIKEGETRSPSGERGIASVAAPDPDRRRTAHRLTVRCQVTDRHVRVLRRMARQVNQVWNYCNETSHRAITRDGRWLHHFDFARAPLKGTSLTIAETWAGDTHIPQLTVGEVGILHPPRPGPPNLPALARLGPAPVE